MLGVESYALIGLFLTVQVLVGVLDLGLSATLTRELARCTTNSEDSYGRDLLRTFETLYWAMACAIALAAVALGPWVGSAWLNASALSAQTVGDSVLLMGLVIAAQWPYAAYAGGLVGLQEQVRLNGLRATLATTQGVGAVGVLTWISNTIEAFFVWQCGVLLVQTLLARWLLMSRLPGSAIGARFRLDLLRRNLPFSVGMAGISLASIALTQADKVLLSRLLPLREFGAYMLAYTLGTSLQYLVMPFISAFFPRFSQLVAAGDERGLADLYHKGTRILVCVILPAGAVLAFLPSESLTLWLGDDLERTPHLSAATSLLALGSIANALVALPYALQLAHGWTTLSFWKNVVALIVLLPSLYWLVGKFGLAGAAAAWLCLNIGYYLLEIPLMHRRILRNEMGSWYAIDTGLPLICCAAAVVTLGTEGGGGGTRLDAALSMALFWGGLAVLCIVVFIAVGRLEGKGQNVGPA